MAYKENYIGEICKLNWLNQKWSGNKLKNWFTKNY